MARLALEFDASARLLPPWQEGVRAASPWIFIRVGRQPSASLLDTGAAWSIVRRDLALAAGFPLEGLRAALSTRLGRRSGTLVAEVPLAIECEQGWYEVDATCFVPDEGDDDLPVLLGWRGLLEKVGFALAPGDASTPARLYLALPGVSSG